MRQAFRFSMARWNQSDQGFLGVSSVVFSFYRLNSRLMKAASSDYLLP